MIEVIFSIDYEVYGNGEGSLTNLVYAPAKKLKDIFDGSGARFVVFAEAAEFEKMADFNSDPAINKVHDQLRMLHEQGYEIALHLHPQWYQGVYREGRWELDYNEYNLCTLPEKRIREVVSQSISYLRKILNDSEYTPLSFRAGNWLFQPTGTVARVLSEQGIKVDSSVFKGGRQHKHGLDYRPAKKNGYWWTFKENVNTPEANGHMLEIPIYSCMVPIWKMATGKRIRLQQKSNAASVKSIKDRFYSLLDRARFFHPLKFDFCRMTLDELIGMVESVAIADRKTPNILKPMVAIGHTKDLVDFKTVDAFLSYLSKKNISVSTFRNSYEKIHR